MTQAPDADKASESENISDGEDICACRPLDANSVLLLRVKRHGDESAYKDLYGYYYPRLRAFYNARNLDDVSAQDLAQEVLIKVWRKADQFSPGRANASAWIFTIARNALIDKVRRRKRRQIDPDDPFFAPQAPPTAEQTIVARATSAAIAEALKALPADQERILRMTYMQGRKQSEIAQELAMPLNTVKSKIRRGVQILRKSIGSL